MSEQFALVQGVRRIIEPVLSEHGFVLTELQDEPFDVVRYERYDDRSALSFHNDREMGVYVGEIRLFVAAYSSGDPGGSIFSLKELLPNFLSIPLLERHCWTYHNQDELAVCLEEILQIIDERLFEWFKHPVSNPAKVPLPPAAKLTPNNLRKMIESQEYWLKQAHSEGDPEKIARMERSLAAMRRNLERLMMEEGKSEE